MHSNVNLEATVGALGFLGACLLMAALGVVSVHALLAGKLGRARFSATACVGNTLE
ncbi:MAG: hypothetical protein M3416_18275 [Acidobacteriota bacterium]|nr:hypothetical protein [Acidobacteriota bacterium]